MLAPRDVSSKRLASRFAGRIQEPLKVLFAKLYRPAGFGIAEDPFPGLRMAPTFRRFDVQGQFVPHNE